MNYRHHYLRSHRFGLKFVRKQYFVPKKNNLIFLKLFDAFRRQYINSSTFVAERDSSDMERYYLFLFIYLFLYFDLL